MILGPVLVSSLGSVDVDVLIAHFGIGVGAGVLRDDKVSFWATIGEGQGTLADAAIGVDHAAGAQTDHSVQTGLGQADLTGDAQVAAITVLVDVVWFHVRVEACRQGFAVDGQVCAEGDVVAVGFVHDVQTEVEFGVAVDVNVRAAEVDFALACDVQCGHEQEAVVIRVRAVVFKLEFAVQEDFAAFAVGGEGVGAIVEGHDCGDWNAIVIGIATGRIRGEGAARIARLRADIKFVAECLAEGCQTADDRGWATAGRDTIDDAAQQGRVFFGELSEVDVFGQVSGRSCWDAAGAATVVAAVVAAVSIAVGVVVNRCGGAGDGWGAFWGAAGTEGENPECCHNPCFGLLHTDLPEFVLGPPSLGLRFKSKEQLSEYDVEIQILDPSFSSLPCRIFHSP